MYPSVRHRASTLYRTGHGGVCSKPVGVRDEGWRLEAGGWRTGRWHTRTLRDYRKLRAFELADELALAVYAATAAFPRREQFGLTAQLRRSAVSVPSNVVEGCARRSQADYLRFLDIAYGSSRELGYQFWLAVRLGYLDDEAYEGLHNRCEETSKVLNGLMRAFRR